MSPTTSERLIALCRRCGNSYDVDFEPAMTCHVGPDDWTVLVVNQDNELEGDLLDLTDAWHDRTFDHGVGLSEVIRGWTGWDESQYGDWVSFGYHHEVKRE